MADQVNPLGGLASGMVQTLQLTAVPSSLKPAPSRTVESKPKAEDRRDAGVSKENLEAAVKSVEGFLQQSPTDLKFMVDKATGTYFIRILDPTTHETIRQIPSEEVLAMAKRLRALSNAKDASGILVDKEG